MNTYTIEYWDCGDCLRTAEVEAENREAAIKALVNDPQHPLGQVKRVLCRSVQNEEIELEILITEREGMLAENRQRALLCQSMAYSESDFHALAEKMLQLLPDQVKRVVTVTMEAIS